MKVLGWLAAKNAMATSAESPSPVRSNGEAFWNTYSSPYFSIRRSIKNIGTENAIKNSQAVRYSGRHSRAVNPPRKASAPRIVVARKNIHDRQTKWKRKIRLHQAT